MATIYATPINITCEHRGRTYAAVSTDGIWQYRYENERWTVTHTPTGRRYWDRDINLARMATWDGTADTLLQTDVEPASGKPMVNGEHKAICGELSTADTRSMIGHAYRAVPAVVDDALERIGQSRTPVAELHPVDATNVLGVVYGVAPEAWLDALRGVRGDLVPQQHTAQAA